MFRPQTPASRAPATRVLTALLLLASLGAFQASHLKHHYDHADCHADHDGRTDAICIVFHTGTLVESVYTAPLPGAAALARLAVAAERAQSLLVLPVHEARAPPVST